MKRHFQIAILPMLLAGCGGGADSPSAPAAIVSSGTVLPVVAAPPSAVVSPVIIPMPVSVPEPATPAAPVLVPDAIVTLPTPIAPYTVNLKDFGAIGDGSHDDQDSGAWEKAYAALPENGGVIKITAGVFGPIKFAVTKKNIVLSGAGMPKFKVDSSGLEGGTVIKGPLVADADGFQASDLGVDSGSTVVATLYADLAQEGLSFRNIGLVIGKPARTGVIFHNISSILKTSVSPNHAVLLENVSGANIDNIHTRFGVHGIVLKAVDTTATALFADSHGTNGVIIKSDNYAPTHGVMVSDVTVTADVVESGGGVRIQAATADMSDIDISHVTTKAGNFGIIVEANTSNVSGVKIRDVSIQGATLYGFIANSVQNSFIKGLIMENVTVNNSGLDGFTFKGTLYNSSATNVAANSNGRNGYELGLATIDAFSLFNAKSSNNGAYGFNWTGIQGVYFHLVSDSGSKLGLSNMPSLPVGPNQ